MATLRGALPSLLGIAAGIASSIVISYLGMFGSAKAKAPEPAAMGRVTELPSVPGSTGLEQATQRQAERLAALEQRVATLPSAASTAASAPASQERPLEQPEEAEVRFQSAHDELRAQHRREAVDAAWARPATESLQTDLSGLGKSAGFAVNRVECRSNSCVATLDWASRDDAKRDLGALLDAKLGRDEDRCAKDVYFDDVPLNAAGKYQADVVFTCRRGEPMRTN